MHFKRFFDLARKSVSAWSDDYAPSMGAAIAYYTVFSLAPLLLIVIAVAGAVFGREAVQGEIVAQLQGLLGYDGAIAIQGLIKSASKPADGLVAGGISIVVLIVGATTVFGELQSALDRIWQVPQNAKSGLMGTLKARLLSFGLILGLAFLLMVSLVVSAGVAVVGRWAGGIIPGWAIALQLLNLGISLGITTLLFAMIYKLMPQARIAWRDVWVGAGVTAVLFEVGKLLIGLYVGKTSVASSYAAAGSIIVLLVWVYYSAQIFLLGAEFTWVFANEHGSRSGHAGTQAVRSSGAAGASASGVPTKQASSGTMASPTAASPASSRQQALVTSSQEPNAPPSSNALHGHGARGPTWQQKAAVYGTLAVLQIAVRIAMGRADAKRRLRRR
ncbi:YihY/virulence factor BrkB family protein [Xylophilus sp. GOD-11R]|uniref:YihY/virulence factor BrkB family protein n=1 Tax=Xylophilus sp. GOD-11R TaxID=3089814 RepID=UPI00298C5562|nr:YihY/virulence factor BrkB family protein [Xylophilus sp. GOD-11R]WPB58033.1 YihY/virulence factor BrkB family protein [Xylophilus sp. GOD-11R]